MQPRASGAGFSRRGRWRCTNTSTRWKRARPSCASARSSRACRGRSRTRRRTRRRSLHCSRTSIRRRSTRATALARLPVTRKSELLELQQKSRPFGGLAATRWGAARRVFASPGPDLRARRRCARLLASRARALRRRLPRPATSCTTASRITSRRPARCSKPARTRSAARCSPAASGRPSSRCRRWPN